MRILLFGGSGQIGRAIRNAACHQAHFVNAPPHDQCDITDLGAVEKWVIDYQPTHIINAACNLFADDCEKNPSAALDFHTTAQAQMARVAEHYDAACVYLSSDFVFDGKKRTPYIETDLPNPINYYGEVKHRGEMLSDHYCQRTYIIRTASVFGAPNDHSRENFVNKMLRKALLGEPSRVVCDVFMSPTYDEWLASRILYILANRPPAIYHVTGSGYASWFELAQRIYDWVGSSEKVEPVTSVETFVEGYGAVRPVYSALGTMRGFSGHHWKHQLYDYFRKRSIYLDNAEYNWAVGSLGA